MEQLHPDEYYDTYRLIQAYLAYLDLQWPLAASPDKSPGKRKH